MTTRRHSVGPRLADRPDVPIWRGNASRIADIPSEQVGGTARRSTSLSKTISISRAPKRWFGRSGTRNHPGSKGELVYEDESKNPLIAYIEDTETRALRMTQAIYNCLDIEQLRGKLPRRSWFRSAYPRAMQERAQTSWITYDYDEATE